MVWRDVMRAAVRVRDGLPWVASNADLSLPTPFGRGARPRRDGGPARAVRGVEAVVAGKPRRPLLDETVRRVGGERPLMVGDRLDTDIEGAHEAEVDSLLVLTGVTGLADLVAARPRLRPTYLSADLGGLFEPHAAPEQDGDAWALGRLAGAVADGRLEVYRRRRPGRLVARGGVRGLGAPRPHRRARRTRRGLAAPDAAETQPEGSLGP